MTLISFILGVFEFAKDIRYFIDLLRKTPAEKRASFRLKLKAASELADTGDTSGYDDIFR